jgi:ketosteroid isomerase-like protein
MREVVVTRVQQSGPPRRSRNLVERLMVRFPSLYPRFAALIFGRLGPRSRLRRAVGWRAVLSGWASFDRRDFELNQMFFAPDVEFEYVGGMQTLGVGAPAARGYAARSEAFGELLDVWASDLELAYLVDVGDRMLNLGFWRTRTHASGVPLEQEFAQLLTLRDGLVSREQYFFSWQEGFRAADLDSDAIAVPKPREVRH